MLNPANKRAPRYADYGVTLAVGEHWTFTVDAEFCACLEATDDFKIGFDAPPISLFKKGLRFKEPAGFMDVLIENTSAAANTIVLAIGRGEFDDSRLNISGSITSRAERPDVFTEQPETAVAFGAAPSVLAANPKRKIALFVNTGTVELWLKSTNGTTKKGTKLAAGQPAGIEVTGEIFAYNPHGSVAGALSISETEFS